jgi:hypothetical protein
VLELGRSARPDLSDAYLITAVGAKGKELGAVKVGDARGRCGLARAVDAADAIVLRAGAGDERHHKHSKRNTAGHDDDR